METVLDNSVGVGPQQGAFDRLEHFLGVASRVVAIACVCGMLFVAGITVFDVIQRWLGFALISGINEIVEMTFAVAIAACIPAGIVQRVNLKIDLSWRVAAYYCSTPCWLGASSFMQATWSGIGRSR